MTHFRLADSADDKVLRGLLRANGMPSWVEMSIEREPSFFASKVSDGTEWAVIAEKEGQAFGMYTAAVMSVYVNGKPVECGYLGGLRVNSHERNRIRHLRQGYASIRRLAPAKPELSWWFTLIAAENARARRLLEAGISGMPIYRSLGSMTTFALSCRQGRQQNLWRHATDTDIPALLAFHADHASNCNLAPVLTLATVRRIGVQTFLLHEEAGQIVAIVSCWDQSAFRQVVAKSYHRALRWALSFYNAFAWLAGRVTLPRPGRALEQSFLAFLTFHPSVLESQSRSHRLLIDLLANCKTPVASVGLRDDHPLVPLINRLNPLRYKSVVYSVEFDAVTHLDDRPVQPEVALS